MFSHSDLPTTEIDKYLKFEFFMRKSRNLFLFGTRTGSKSSQENYCQGFHMWTKTKNPVFQSKYRDAVKPQNLD